MSSSRPARQWVLAAAAGLALAAGQGGCGDGGTSPTPAPRVVVHFDHTVAGDSLLLYSVRFTNAAGNRYSVSKLEYFVSRLRLVRADSTEVGLKQVHYRNAESLATRDVRVDIPNGRYVALRFTFGLDDALNRTGALPSELWHDMAWPEIWGGGYHYMQMEGQFVDSTGSSTRGYATHTGRRNVAGDPMPSPHFFAVELPLGPIDVHDDAWDVRLVMDVDQWYRDPNLYDFRSLPANIMIDTAVQTRLEQNGADVFGVAAVQRLGP